MSKNLSWTKEHYLVSTDKSLLQVLRIHNFLSTKGYWCLDIPKEIVEKSIENSLCFGLYNTSDSNLQIGYARIVSDRATFAWLCDVYIEEENRGHGLSKWLMDCVISHPYLKNLRRIWLLALALPATNDRPANTRPMIATSGRIVPISFD